MIKAIIFDWGGVHTRGKIAEAFCRALAKKKSIHVKRVFEAYETNNHAYLLGKMNGKKFFSLLAEKLDISTPYATLINMFIQTASINKQMITLTKKLKRNYKLAILSDNYDELSAQIIKEYNLRSRFDVLIFSNKVGLKKPDRRIYQLTLDRLGLEGKECIFIDDKPKNIAAAKKCGIHSILFTSTDKLKKDLVKLGIKEME